MLRMISSSLLRQSSVSSNGLQNAVLHSNGVRFLYTIEALGIDAYCSQRMRVGLQFNQGPEMKEKFFTRMEKYFGDGQTENIFAEDLKITLSLAEDNKNDLVLINRMIAKYHNQEKEDNFVFGPVIMRFFHHLNKPQEALELVTNSKTVHIFDQFISYQILMDLLLNNEMYDDVVSVFSQVQDRNIKNVQFPKNCLLLVASALYKMNTSESFEKAKSLLDEYEKLGTSPPLRRVLTYTAMLALKQNKPEEVLSILEKTSQSNYVTVLHLRLLAFAKLGQFSDVIAILRGSVHEGLNRPRMSLKEVLVEVGDLIEASGQQDIQLEFQRVLNIITNKGAISNQSLVTLIDAPIMKKETAWAAPTEGKEGFNSGRQMVSNFNQRGSRKQVPNRPGLGDMD